MVELVENGHRDAAELLLDRGGRSSPKTIIEYHPECEFAGSYQRNNKRHGQKNLRCFPMCRAAVSHTPPICVHAITTITNPMYPLFEPLSLARPLKKARAISSRHAHFVPCLRL